MTPSAIARIEAGDSAPAFDPVLRLVRLCGLDLDVMLVPRDDSDWNQALRLVPLSAQERLEHHQGVLRHLQQMRQAGAAAHAGS